MQKQNRRGWKLAILFLIAVAGVLFLIRGSLVTVGLQWVVKTALHESLSYETKNWREGTLSLTGVKVGDLLAAEELHISFAMQRPLYLEMHVGLSHPKIRIDPHEPSTVSPAFFLPSKHFGIKWSIGEGVLEIPHEGKNLFFPFDFSSGKTEGEMGVLSVYDATSLLLSLEMRTQEDLLCAQVEVPSIAITALVSEKFSYLEKVARAVGLKGEFLFNHQGDILSFSCQLAGDVDYLGKKYPLDVQSIGKQREVSTYLTLGLENGVKTEVTGSIVEEASAQYNFTCNVQHLSKELVGLIQEGLSVRGEAFDWGSGEFSGDLNGIIDKGEIKQLSCQNGELIGGYIQLPARGVQGFIERAQFSGTFKKKKEWNIVSFACDMTECAVSSQEWKGSGFHGTIGIDNHVFHNTQLKGEFQGIVVEVSLSGPVDAFEMTTELASDSKGIFELLMGKSSEELPFFPVHLAGSTKKHAEGYSVSGKLSLWGEEIAVGAELTGVGDLKHGWFFSDYCSEKVLTPFFCDCILTGDLSFKGTFDKKSIECFVQGEQLVCSIENLEIQLPMLGIKDREFLETEGWAHVTYLVSENTLAFHFPFTEVYVKDKKSGCALEHLEGECTGDGKSITLKHLAGKYKEIELQGEVECLLSGQKDREVTGSCTALRIPLSSQHRLEQVSCRFKQKEITHLTGNLCIKDKKYQLSADSILYTDAGILFDAQLREDKELLLQVAGKCLPKSTTHLAFSLRGNFAGALLEDVSFEIKEGKEITSFSSTSRFKGKDLARQLHLLEDFGIATCDPALLTRIATLEGELKGKLLFSPNSGFLFEAEGKDLALEQESISHFELKGKKIAEQWILEKMRTGDFELKGSLLKAQDKWFCPYWEVQWKDVVAKGQAAYVAGDFSLSVSKVEGLLPVGYSVRSEREAHFLLSSGLEIKGLLLGIGKEGKKIGSLSAGVVTYGQGEWSADDVIGRGEGFSMKDPVSISWKDHILGIASPRNEQLFLSFSESGNCKEIKGHFWGLNCALERVSEQFAGTITIENGSVLATICPKALFFLKDIAGVELRGLWKKREANLTFTGEMRGTDICLKGYHIAKTQAKLDFTPEKIFVRDLFMSDKAGSFSVKQLLCLYNPADQKWQLSIPIVRGKEIRPSLLQKITEGVKQEKPFIIRTLLFENIAGDLNNLASWTGQGSFNFTNVYKKEFSIFDTPLEWIKNLGFDPCLFTPISGHVVCYLKNGALRFSELKNTYSEGNRSQFYLAPDLEPSTLDMQGNLCINLRMKQDVVLKFGEPFALSIQGSVDKPRYKLR